MTNTRDKHLYHLLPTEKLRACQDEGTTYYPKTFEQVLPPCTNSIDQVALQWNILISKPLYDA